MVINKSLRSCHPERSKCGKADEAQLEDPVAIRQRFCRSEANISAAWLSHMAGTVDGISVAPPASSPALSRKASALRLRAQSSAPLRIDRVKTKMTMPSRHER